MMVFRSRRMLGRASSVLALTLGVAAFTACAEIEVGAEAAKRISRATSDSGSASAKNVPESGDIQLAQATNAEAEDLPISPFLEPAPQLFEATGQAVWDGKRTLQGVWVAHPLAESARRVRIFNEQNGRAVDGALFKRDAAAEDASSVLISSEAAKLLGMGVGTPALIRIVAVSPIQRQPQPQPEQPADAVVAEVQPTDTEITDLAASGESDTEVPVAAIATTTAVAAGASAESPVADAESASTDAVDDKVVLAATQTAPEDSVESIASDVRETVTSKASETASEQVVEETLQTAAETTQEASELAASDATSETTNLVTPLAPASKPEPVAKVEPETIQKAEPEPVKAKPEPIKLETPRVAAVEPAKQAQPAASPGTSTLKLPYVQAGIFGVKSNATALIRRIEAKDLPALGREIKSGGKTLTKVLAGPFQSVDQRNAALRTIRSMGLKDAAPVRR